MTIPTGSPHTEACQVQYPLPKDTKYQSHPPFLPSPTPGSHVLTLFGAETTAELGRAPPTQRRFLTPLDHRISFLPGFHAAVQAPPIIGIQWLLKAPGQEAGPWCNLPQDARELGACRGPQNDTALRIGFLKEEICIRAGKRRPAQEEWELAGCVNLELAPNRFSASFISSSTSDPLIVQRHP